MDEGISGKNITERPAVTEMIEDIKKGKVKNVLIYKIDRLTRSTADLIYLINLFNDYDCAFNSLSESIDTQTATGRMFIKIIGIFAEFERENISERARLGFERKAREGYSMCGGNPSYGYDMKKGEKIQTINETEAKIVREIFHMFAQNHMPYLEIAKNLNNRNIPTKLNLKWHSKTIKKVLTNCNYKGYIRYARHDEKRNFEAKGLHEPIISEELYNETQELIKKISVKVYKKHPKENNYFAGILYCGSCGEKLLARIPYRKNKNGVILSWGSYRCKNRYKGTCTACEVSHDNVEKAFVEYINNYEDFNTLDEVQLSMKKEIKDKNIERIKDFRKQYEKLEQREKEILQEYIQEKIDSDSFMAIKKTVDDEKKKISTMIEAIEILVDEEITVQKENIIKNLKENWEFLNNSEKRHFLIDFVERIDIVNNKPVGKREGTVKILNVKFNS